MGRKGSGWAPFCHCRLVCKGRVGGVAAVAGGDPGTAAARLARCPRAHFRQQRGQGQRVDVAAGHHRALALSGHAAAGGQGQGAGALGDQVFLQRQPHQGLAQFGLAHDHHVVEQARAQASGNEAGHLDPDAVGQGACRVQRAQVAVQGAGHRVHAFDLGADHAHPLRLQRQGHARGQAATADGHDHHVGRIRGDLHAEGALAGNHVRVVECGQEAISVLLGQLAREGEGLVVAVAVLAHGGAPVGHAGNLVLRRAMRHHRDRLHAQAVRGPGHALGVVAGRGADHRALVAAFARGQQRVQRTAHLVRTGALQVFQLEHHPEALGVVHRRDRQVRAQPRLRGQHVGDADFGHAGVDGGRHASIPDIAEVGLLVSGAGATAVRHR